MKALLATALLLFSTQVYAANINQGNVEVDGAFQLSQTWVGGNDSTYLDLSAAGQYFFVDRFSAGAELGYAHSGGTDLWSLAPVGTFYFGVSNQLAPYVYVKPIELSDASYRDLNLSSAARFGVKFFLNDSIAFGPALQYDHVWGTNRPNSANSVSLLGLFAMHL